MYKDIFILTKGEAAAALKEILGDAHPEIAKAADILNSLKRHDRNNESYHALGKFAQENEGNFELAVIPYLSLTMSVKDQYFPKQYNHPFIYKNADRFLDMAEGYADKYPKLAANLLHTSYWMIGLVPETELERSQQKQLLDRNMDLICGMIEKYRDTDRALAASLMESPNDKLKYTGDEKKYGFFQLVNEVASSWKDIAPKNTLKALSLTYGITNKNFLSYESEPLLAKALVENMSIRLYLAEKNYKKHPALAAEALEGVLSTDNVPGYSPYSCDINKVVDVFKGLAEKSPQLALDTAFYGLRSAGKKDKRFTDFMTDLVKENPKLDLKLNEPGQYYWHLYNHAHSDEEKNNIRQNFTAVLPELAKIYQQSEPDKAANLAQYGLICCNDKGGRQCHLILQEIAEKNKPLVIETLRKGVEEAAGYMIFQGHKNISQRYLKAVTCIKEDKKISAEPSTDIGNILRVLHLDGLAGKIDAAYHGYMGRNL